MRHFFCHIFCCRCSIGLVRVHVGIFVSDLNCLTSSYASFSSWGGCIVSVQSSYIILYDLTIPYPKHYLISSLNNWLTVCCIFEQLLDDITASLDMLGSIYVHPDSSFEHLIKVTMISEGFTTVDSGSSSPIPRDRTLQPALVTKAWTTLRTLLHSPHSICRSNGYSWLLELLCAEMARGGSKQSSKLNTHALQRQLSLLGSLERATETGSPEKASETPTISSAARLLCGLLKAKQPVVRRGFVLILEKLLLHCQRPGLELETLSTAADGEAKDGSRSSGAQDRALAMLGLMNGALWQVISANDTDRINILQVHRIFYFISSPSQC